ncbi:DUF7002 family protein [Mesorhizobium kowhaii]|uniref:Uncharacterized protein n=1 Tax=Mesorhizobium kowhaii TaxID=1300272 RepID=A0A2W7C1W5_9HYPH|nr:hypothetical protein [Mesorhizobium kowhaii]PZV37052.1 hypothetical protein B5V02_18445 [Mesorhizobium kowhaii]
MTVDELTALHPRLWHMAADASWPSIQQYGLLSTSSLLDLYGYKGEERVALESIKRPKSVQIDASGLPGAIVRDQKPMSDKALNKCLQDGLTPIDWYQLLNEKVFFWLTRARLQTLLAAYAHAPQIVLTLDTATLVEAHAENILLCPINSGSTIMNPAPRGAESFLAIEDFPYETWRLKRGNKRKAVVELVVTGGVSDVANHVLAVHRIVNGAVAEIWRRPGDFGDVGP